MIHIVECGLASLTTVIGRNFWVGWMGEDLGKLLRELVRMGLNCAMMVGDGRG